ncbi:MAG: tryptophan synthase subunit alpha [Myxococcota bacterium]
MKLADYISERRRQRDILLMTHIVIGYPSLSVSLELVDAMVEAGVDMMELQIPFSEPIADGPVILHANQRALQNGTKVNDCFEFAAKVTARHSIPFLFMSYYNVVFRRGCANFAERSVQAGVRGAIVPDCPPEEASEYISAMRAQNLAPVFIFSPRTPDSRLAMLGEAGDGFVYAVARKGVTGQDTEFSDELAQYLARCRRATKLPLAVGFGLKSPSDVDFLRGKADIAVVGTESLRLLEKSGVSSVAKFLSTLRG